MLWNDALDCFCFAICENYMHRNGNLGLKNGVSPAAHTQYAIHTKGIVQMKMRNQLMSVPKSYFRYDSCHQQI